MSLALPSALVVGTGLGPVAVVVGIAELVVGLVELQEVTVGLDWADPDPFSANKEATREAASRFLILCTLDVLPFTSSATLKETTWGQLPPPASLSAESHF